MTERKAHLDALAIVALVACCLIWGLNQVAAKVSLHEISPLWQASIRSIGGAVLVWAWSRHRGIPLFERDGTLPGGLLAGLLFAAEFGCMFIGQLPPRFLWIIRIGHQPAKRGMKGEGVHCRQAVLLRQPNDFNRACTVSAPAGLMCIASAWCPVNSAKPRSIS